MKYKDLVTEVQKLRDEYIHATPSRKQELEKLGKEKSLLLSTTMGCYQCDEAFSKESDLMPYCSEACHKKHADTYYAQYGRDRFERKMSIEEMQQKLLEFAQDEHKRGEL